MEYEKVLVKTERKGTLATPTKTEGDFDMRKGKNGKKEGTSVAGRGRTGDSGRERHSAFGL